MHKVTVSVQEDDVLKRVALLNAAIFRILAAARRWRVTAANYEDGSMTAIIEADEAVIPEVEGEVRISVERVTAFALRDAA